MLRNSEKEVVYRVCSEANRRGFVLGDIYSVNYNNHVTRDQYDKRKVYEEYCMKSILIDSKGKSRFIEIHVYEASREAIVEYTSEPFGSFTVKIGAKQNDI